MNFFAGSFKVKYLTLPFLMAFLCSCLLPITTYQYHKIRDNLEYTPQSDVVDYTFDTSPKFEFTRNISRDEERRIPYSFINFWLGKLKANLSKSESELIKNFWESFFDPIQHYFEENKENLFVYYDKDKSHLIELVNWQDELSLKFPLFIINQTFSKEQSKDFRKDYAVKRFLLPFLLESRELLAKLSFSSDPTLKLKFDNEISYFIFEIMYGVVTEGSFKNGAKGEMLAVILPKQLILDILGEIAPVDELLSVATLKFSAFDE